MFSIQFSNFILLRGEVVSTGDTKLEFRERETGRMTVSLARFAMRRIMGHQKY
jgi:hypothetical protein